MKGVRLIPICLAGLLALGGLLGVTASAGATRGSATVSPEVVAAEAAEEAAEVAAEAAEESAVTAAKHEFPGWNYRIQHKKKEIARKRMRRHELRELPRTERVAERIARKTEEIHEIRASLHELREKFKAHKKEVKEK